MGVTSICETATGRDAEVAAHFLREDVEAPSRRPPFI
jgi:hypothetical protein